MGSGGRAKIGRDVDSRMVGSRTRSAHAPRIVEHGLRRRFSPIGKTTGHGCHIFIP